MTLILELEPEVENALAQQAARHGVPVERYAAAVLGRQAQRENGDDSQSEREKHRAAVRALRGKRKDLVETVDDLLRERHEEARREMEEDAVSGRRGIAA